MPSDTDTTVGLVLLNVVLMCMPYAGQPQDYTDLLEVLGNTINGTIYAGIRAKTTAAPQQMWFGPSGDPRSGGIHTPEAIKLVWSSHREIMYDYGPVPADHAKTQS